MVRAPAIIATPTPATMPIAAPIAVRRGATVTRAPIIIVITPITPTPAIKPTGALSAVITVRRGATVTRAPSIIVITPITPTPAINTPMPAIKVRRA